MNCPRCGAPMVEGSPCPVCGTRVVHIRDTGEDLEPSVRRLRSDTAVTVRRPAPGMPRLIDPGTPSKAARAIPYLLGLAAGAGAAVLLGIYLWPAGDSAEGEVEPGGGAAASRAAPDVGAGGDPNAGTAGALPAEARLHPRDARTRYVPEAVAALAAATRDAADEAPAIAPPRIPGTPPRAPSAADACPIPDCVPEGGPWEVADRARLLLREDPGLAACWARQSVHLGRRFDMPAIVAAGYYHLGVALQILGCRDRAHDAYLRAVCDGKRSTTPHLLEGYIAACERTGEGCENPCDSAAETVDPAAQ